MKSVTCEGFLIPACALPRAAFSFFLLCCLLLMAAFCPSGVFAASCDPDPAVHYEVVFCALKNRGKLPLAPELESFRKNPPAMQYLLLKRHAERQRIKLEKPGGIVSNLPQALAETAKPKTDAAVANRPVHTALSCQLQQSGIECGGKRYRWQGNRNNRELALGVLEDTYPMALPVFSPVYPSVEDYLAEAYLRYIARMHDIGLAAETLGYTRFVTIFAESRKNRSDFAGRFETMYRFLKIDRKSMAVRTVKPDLSSVAVAACSILGEQFVTCESGRQNHVFIRE